MSTALSTWLNSWLGYPNNWVVQVGMWIEPYWHWRYVVFVLLFALVQGGAWWLWGVEMNDAWSTSQQDSSALKQRYQQQRQQNQRREQLQAQLQAISGHVQALETQLPHASEMDSLLSSINQAGLGRSLQFELFKPATAEFKTDYAEQRIALRLTGLYDDIGAFAADVANLDRIMVLGDLNLMPVPEKIGPLTLTAVLRTFRYLTPEERAASTPTAPVSNDKKIKKTHKGKNHAAQ